MHEVSFPYRDVVFIEVVGCWGSGGNTRPHFLPNRYVTKKIFFFSGVNVSFTIILLMAIYPVFGLVAKPCDESHLF